MVTHSLKGVKTSTPSTIYITELQNDCLIEIDDDKNNSCKIVFDLKQLHNFIGTLLHVQQKLKNK